jgi:hypothetical protein
MSVQGVKEIKDALAKHRHKSAKGLRVGLLRAGLFLQRESQKIVPVDTNALRASANTRAEGAGFDVAVVVSYGTDYALYVHENLEARHKPGKSAKFLEKPIREKRKRIQQIAVEGMESVL